MSQPRRCMRLVSIALATVLSLLLAGCGQAPRVAELPAVENDWPAPVSAVLERVEHSASDALDVGVVVFAGGDSGGEQEASYRVREIEVRLMAHRLRETLESSNAWGAVRILPATSPLVPLTISGEVVHSDGSDLVIDLEAVDATGRVWLRERLHGRAAVDAYPVTAGADPFDGLWASFANRLAAFWQGLSALDRAEIEAVASLNYAAALAPTVFGDYREIGVDGRVRARRLPAEGDPMLARIQRIRNYEYLFIDAIDEQFVDLQAAVGPTYNAWREANKAQADWLTRYRQRVAARSDATYAGEFASLHAVYATYRAVRVQQQDLFDFAMGFSNESTPLLLDYEGRIVELDGTLESRYSEWRQLLTDIFRLEYGFAD